MTNCSNCKGTIQDKFCGNCGQPAQLKRIDGHFILHEIQHVLHLEKGIFYTVKELCIRPGKAVRTFVSEDRNRLVKPIIFLVVCSLIYSLVNHAFHAEVVPNPELESIPVFNFILHWMEQHYGYTNLIMGIFISIWLKLFFNKQGYNFFEILILLCFVLGNGMLIFALLLTIEKLAHLHFGQIVMSLPVLVYTIWAIGQFFGQKKIGSYLKALAAYALGMVSFYFLLILVTIISVIISR